MDSLRTTVAAKGPTLVSFQMAVLYLGKQNCFKLMLYLGKLNCLKMMLYLGKHNGQWFEANCFTISRKRPPIG